MAGGNPDNYKNAKSIYEFSARDENGEDIPLKRYKGHVAIIVNLCAQCDYTENHYNELQELYEKYADEKGLRILGFPCTQFAGQKPGNAADSGSIIDKIDVTFDVFNKIDVNGSTAHPLWKYLKYKQKGTFFNFIKWNFTKFIIDKEGQPVARFGANTTPKELVPMLEKYW